MTEDDSISAAEYVLGLGDAAEHARSAARIAVDPEFAAEMEYWVSKLAPLLGARERTPPPHVWKRISQSLGRDTGQNDNPRQFRLFKFAAGIAALIFVGIAVSLWLATPGVAPMKAEVAIVATLNGQNPGEAITARLTPDRQELALIPVGLAARSGFPELWIVPKRGTARSLGAVRYDIASRVTLSREDIALLNAGAALAVTAEPDSAIPHQKAGGPVIASGTILPA